MPGQNKKAVKKTAPVKKKGASKKKVGANKAASAAKKAIRKKITKKPMLPQSMKEAIEYLESLDDKILREVYEQNRAFEYLDAIDNKQRS
jgi:hypothetical protein